MNNTFASQNTLSRFDRTATVNQYGDFNPNELNKELLQNQDDENKDGLLKLNLPNMKLMSQSSVEIGSGRKLKQSKTGENFNPQLQVPDNLFGKTEALDKNSFRNVRGKSPARVGMSRMRSNKPSGFEDMMFDRNSAYHEEDEKEEEK